MDYNLAISELFDAIQNDNEKEAVSLLTNVGHELRILEQIPDLNASAKEVITKIEQLKYNIACGKISIARAKCSAVKAGFNGQLKAKLQETLTDRKDVKLLPSSIANQNKTRTAKDVTRYDNNKRYHDKQYDAERQQQHQEIPQNTQEIRQDNSRDKRQYSENVYYRRKGSHNETNLRSTHTSESNEANVEMRKKPVIHGDEEFGKDQKSKRASQAMRQNNPDIADLSDINRPTKIGERFSELYDNEWTEAFEALSKTKKRQLKESEIINILLHIVEEAYQFCIGEAEQQINMIESAFSMIMTGEKTRSATQSDRNDENGMRRNLLVQFRKTLAAESIERLSNNFFTKDVIQTFQSMSLDPPKDNGPAAKYTKKAVELTWWMCVQDPPVYMCPTKDEFNRNIYRSYTKSGIKPDFVVWPALKLYKDGGVLLKGVVQYK